MRKNNLKRAMFWLGVGIVIILLLGSRPSAEYTTDVHYVKPGDTLWDIAGEYAGNSIDRREVIYEMQQLNAGLTTQIRPGQEIVVPVYSKE